MPMSEEESKVLMQENENRLKDTPTLIYPAQNDEGWEKHEVTLEGIEIENLRREVGALRVQLATATQILRTWKAWLDADDMMDVETNLHSAEYATEQFLKGGEE